MSGYVAEASIGFLQCACRHILPKFCNGFIWEYLQVIILWLRAPALVGCYLAFQLWLLVCLFNSSILFACTSTFSSSRKLHTQALGFQVSSHLCLKRVFILIRHLRYFLSGFYYPGILTMYDLCCGTWPKVSSPGQYQDHSYTFHHFQTL